MKKGIIIGLILLVGAALLIGPLLKSDEEIVDPAVFEFQDNLQAQLNREIKVHILVASDDIAKMEVVCNDEVLETWKSPKKEDVSFKLNTGEIGMGAKSFNLRVTLNDGSVSTDRRLLRIVSDITPMNFIATVVEPTYPHNERSFTQGLEFYNGRLFEGTGDPTHEGRTLVAEVDLNTGVQKNSIGLDGSHFGEGITILKDRLYQLTWQNQKCLVYDVNTLKVLTDFKYDGEGWGLCNDGTNLFMSNGSERIYTRDPENFTILRTVDVYDDNGPVGNLNELEYINGLIYANVWQTNTVVAFDPETGKVIKRIDCRDLTVQGRGNGDVLNGIAYNPATKKLYMTGKYWPVMFEVNFVQR